jgi:mono/diheme cytochrome c family protein
MRYLKRVARGALFVAASLWIGGSWGLAGCLPREFNDQGFESSRLPRPIFGPTVTQPSSPPPISGGTLLVLSDGRTAVAADSDRDHVWVVDLALGYPLFDLPLSPGDEPGRLVADDKGLVHVALRRGGAVVTIDPMAGTLVARRPVCPAPRGIAYDGRADELHVACAGGEFVTLPVQGEAPVRTLRFEPDLRDVVVDGDRILVSRFRSAELLVVDRAGGISERLAPPRLESPLIHNGSPFVPAVAWRTIASPAGGALMLHQRALTSRIQTTRGGYGGLGACQGGIVHSAVTQLVQGRPSAVAPLLPAAVLVVDLAVSRDGREFAVAVAGNAYNRTLPTVYRGNLSAYLAASDCAAGRLLSPPQPHGQPVAVAFAGEHDLVVQLREPAALWRYPSDGNPPQIITLGAPSREDTGHAIFHGNSGAGVACASCHPEGGDDGRTWDLDLGQRRTQALRGGLHGTEPFHWSGDMPDIGHLLEQVMGERMSGPELTPDQKDVFARWVDRIPNVPLGAPVDPGAVERGRQIFEDPAVGCASCHSGAQHTNSATVDVGTGERFQVPALRGLVLHAPYLHDGCATTLRDRFGRCGGGDRHGHTSQLSEQQLGDLISYLETL